MVNKGFIDEQNVWDIINQGENMLDQIPRLLSKAKEAKGLTPTEVAALLATKDPDIWNDVFDAAMEVKKRIYGNRIVIFAPLYISNYCINHCQYCGYHTGSNITRRKLTQEEITKEVEILQSMGHKRLALETGEDPINCPIEYVLESINTIYNVHNKNGSIRRINVNIAATTVEDYKKLKDANIGTYVLFQETYHRPSYEKYHLRGPKSDYNWHLTAFDRAMQAGIDDVGAGVLFGLYDYRFELISVMLHAAHLEEVFGVGPHTVSVPRLRYAQDVDLSKYPYLVTDADFAKIVALIRLALPYTGIILSTRETPKLRREIIKLGISQISAGSCTGVGAYKEEQDHLPDNTSQFKVEDNRHPDEIYAELCRDGYIPSFCTACYRKGRTGNHFMPFAKTGTIQNFCTPNAILTFQEYLMDYAGDETRLLGERQIERTLEDISNVEFRENVKQRLEHIKKGERDLYY
jgi:2-iminoacetate synthase